MLATILTLLAAAGGQPAAPKQGGGGLFGGDWTTMLMIAGPLLLLWFIVLNPNRRQEKQRKAMLSSLQKNDEVVTVGGILGTVYSIKEKAGGIAGVEDVVTVRIDDKTRINVLRSSILRINRPSDASTSKDKEETKAAT